MTPLGRTEASQYASHRSRTCRCRIHCVLPRLAVVTFTWVVIGLPGIQGQHSKPKEYEVKATYLYSFSRFVEWPGQSPQVQADSFTICVLGENPFGPVLEATVAQETIAGKGVVAKQIPTPQDAANCRVLFISSSEDTRLKQIFTCLGTASVLTVSDLPQFTQRGG